MMISEKWDVAADALSPHPANLSSRCLLMDDGPGRPHQRTAPISELSVKPCHFWDENAVL